MGWRWFSVVLTALFFAMALTFMAQNWTPSSQGSVDAAAVPPTLDTPIGRFVGSVSVAPHNGHKYIAYMGIPYAAPPVGVLRFTRPTPVAPTRQGEAVNSLASKPSCWSVTKSATDPRYGEDCLYLNVYAPYEDMRAVQSGRGPRLPVMVWIHGGGFVAGSAFPEPVKLVTRGQVIVVMVNFRMGVFGFLTTEDDVVPSNIGLWDQSVAIKWVRDNIEHLHGDPASITVFGESSGASCVALHALSPVSSKLFHKAVMQSGAASSLLSRDARQRAAEFGEMVGCPGTGEKFLQCLRNVSIADILRHDKPDSFNISQARRQFDFIWMPVVDGEMVPGEPLSLLANRSHLAQVGAYDKDYVIGILNDEGSLVPENFLHRIPLSEIAPVAFYNDLTQALVHNRYGLNSSAAHMLQNNINGFYLGVEKPVGSVHPHKVLDLASDLLFFLPALETALAVSQCSPELSGEAGPCSFTPASSSAPDCSLASSLAASPTTTTTTTTTTAAATTTTATSTTTAAATTTTTTTSTTSTAAAAVSARTFFYHLDYCPDKPPCSAPCMTHGSDVAYEFPRTDFPDPDQQHLSDLFVDLITSFAKTSDPGQAVSCGWPRFEPDTRKYLRIGRSPSVRQFLYDYRSTFWLMSVPAHLLN
ncbi:para-nitrobenzyl esterase [Aplysia californica]|uniref:Para-nitrobenzyl esterase n=1 Tax=Aplysia californica TaxID=6500 RepID=A0ABM0K7V0_APLCA|nr:para-nitrobenzyl esterase [Aplysia californica]